MKNPQTTIEWSQAIQESKDIRQQQQKEEVQRKELREEMKNDFHAMIGSKGTNYSDIEDMVHGYGFDSDEIEDLIHNFY